MKETFEFSGEEKTSLTFRKLLSHSVHQLSIVFKDQGFSLTNTKSLIFIKSS